MNKIFILVIVFMITSCSSSSMENLGESNLYNNHYYIERHFDVTSPSGNEAVKYYLANIGKGNIEIPPSHMLQPKRENKKIDADGYFENIYVYEKVDGEFEKYDNLLAVKDGREILVPVYHCSNKDWCQLYVPPISRGAYQQYQSGERKSFDKDGLFYFISNGLYVKREDIITEHRED